MASRVWEKKNPLYARIEDLLHTASSGIIGSTAFLTPEESVQAEEYLKQSGYSRCWKLVGGYEDAERKMLLIYPDYLPEECVEAGDYFCALEIRTSGYVKLEHCSFLGALMALGIERDSLGDILIIDGNAVVFVTAPIAAFLLSEPSPLTFVGSDKVRVLKADDQLIASYKRQYKKVEIVVASMRLDCLVAELGNLSREKAKLAISRGEVQLNYRTGLEPSQTVVSGDVLSIHRKGKFKITENGQMTRKDRYRLSVLVYL
jgi:RNA-binding protein YlmH